MIPSLNFGMTLHADHADRLSRLQRTSPSERRNADALRTIACDLNVFLNRLQSKRLQEIAQEIASKLQGLPVATGNEFYGGGDN
jgi:hypothetical protein